MGILHRFDRIFRSKPSHHQGQLAVGCGLDGKPINAQYVLRGMRATVDFYNELDVFHGSLRFFNLSQPWQTLISLALGQSSPSRPAVSQLALFRAIEEQTIFRWLTQRNQTSKNGLLAHY